MLKRVFAALLLPVMLLQLTGCTTQAWVGPGEVSPRAGYRVHSIRTVEGEQVRLDREPPPLIRNDTLYARVASQRYSIAVDQIRFYQVQRPDATKTVLMSLALVGTVLSIGFVIALDDFGGSFNGGR